MTTPTTARMSRGDKIKIAVLVTIVAAIPLYLVVPWAQRRLEDFFSLARAQQQLAEAREEQGYSWTTVLGVAQRLKMPETQKVGAIGFVVRNEKAPADQFLLVRLQISCCAADASPVAVPVQWAEAHTLENNQWVKVFGRTDPKAKALIADKVEPTREPDNPYM